MRMQKENKLVRTPAELASWSRQVALTIEAELF
jgi:hypothetical protein